MIFVNNVGTKEEGADFWFQEKNLKNVKENVKSKIF